MNSYGKRSINSDKVTTFHKISIQLWIVNQNCCHFISSFYFCVNEDFLLLISVIFVSHDSKNISKAINSVSPSDDTFCLSYILSPVKHRWHLRNKSWVFKNIQTFYPIHQTIAINSRDILPNQQFLSW